MKRLFTALFLLTVMLQASLFAGSQRMVVMEEFTQTTCGPCAALNPAYNDWLKTNIDKVLPMSYQVNAGNPMYIVDPMNSRSAYYNVTGTPTLIVNGNAYNGSPQSQSFEGKVTGLNDQESPVTIKCTLANNNGKYSAKVSVISESAISGTLRITLIEAYHGYTGAPNGETNYYFIPRATYPNSNGIKVNLLANKEQTFDYPITLGSDWYPNLLFVGAWLQNDQTKEVIQAGKSTVPNLNGVENWKQIGLAMSTTKSFLKSPLNKTVTQEITLKNDNNVVVKADVNLNYDAPDGWFITIDKPTVTIQAKSSTTVTVTYELGDNNGFALVLLSATPIDLKSAFPKIETKVLGMLSSNSKYVFYRTMTPGDAVYMDALSNTMFYNDFVFPPLTSEVLAEYPPESFAVSFFSFATDPENVRIIPSAVLTGINKAIAAGKCVFASSDITAFWAYKSSAPLADRKPYMDFFEKTLGVTYLASKPHTYVQDNTTYIKQYQLTGFENDTVGRGFAITGNTTAQSFWHIQNDAFKLLENSTANKVAYYDGNLDTVAAVRVQKGNANVVYMGAGIEASLNPFMNRILVDNAMTWFVGKPEIIEPEITSDMSSIEFGDVTINKTSIKQIVIKNIGKKELKIDSAYFDWNNDNVFSLVDYPQGIVKINPKDSIIVKVKFAPKKVEDYTSPELIFVNNDPNQPSYTVYLKGKGKPAEAGAPYIKLNTSELTFGKIVQGNEMTQDIIIKNEGEKDLVVSYQFLNNADKSFKGKTAVIPNIKPGSSYTLTVSFTPKEAKVYNDTLEFTSNDTKQAKLKVALNGEGTPNSITNDGELSGLFNMKLGPNPVMSNSRLSYSVSGLTSKDLSISIIDYTGKEVSLLVNGAVAPGEYEISVSNADIPAGTYFIVATINGNTTSLPMTIVK